MQVFPPHFVVSSQSSNLRRPDPPEKPEGVGPVFLVISLPNLMSTFLGKIPAGFCVLLYLCAPCTPNLINTTTQLLWIAQPEIAVVALNCSCLQQFIPITFLAKKAGYSSTNIFLD